MALVISLPIVVFCVEVFASLFSKPKVDVLNPPTDLDYAVLVPAHNESAVIGEMLESLLTQVDKPEQIIVIADNCEDDSAEIARTYNVQVLERKNLEEKGKGYALAYGREYLSASPPATVVFVDADSTFTTPHGLREIVRQSILHNRPIQAVYLLTKNQNNTPQASISHFAFKVKNLVRPSGLHYLNQSCLLTGTGMAFPWKAIASVPLASGNIVEDMQLGLDLALTGHPPQLAPNVLIESATPEKQSAATSQRTRWEHGHLNTLRTQVPRLTLASLRQKNLKLLSLALDLSIPPLALLLLIWSTASLIAVLFGIITAKWLPTLILITAGIFLFSAVGTAWNKVGKEELPFTTLMMFPAYIAKKLPLYSKYTTDRQTAWVRTERDTT